MGYEYDGIVYNNTKYGFGEIDLDYPEKQMPYVPIDQCGNPHNYRNGWKCINCGHTIPKSPTKREK